MAVALPQLSRAEFSARLGDSAPDEPAIDALLAHYETLRRWAPRLSLIGPGTAADTVERHYEESLRGGAWVPAGAKLLDVGSGGGFPGMILAAADRTIEATLLEPKTRKWAFLEAARRAMSLSCRCLNARVGAASEGLLPDGLDRITLRALRLEPPLLALLARRLGSEGALLFWAGREEPELPPELHWTDEMPLSGLHRRLLRAERR